MGNWGYFTLLIGFSQTAIAAFVLVPKTSVNCKSCASLAMRRHVAGLAQRWVFLRQLVSVQGLRWPWQSTLPPIIFEMENMKIGRKNRVDYTFLVVSADLSAVPEHHFLSRGVGGTGL